MSEATPFANYQNELYLQGLAGERPSLPMRPDDLEQLAADRLDPAPFGYVAGGAASEDTMRANREAFRHWRIVPRMLRDVSVRRTAVEVCGTSLSAPVMLAPIGVQGIVHPDGELAAARAAAELGVGMCLSMAASNTLEDVAAELGDAPKWFQLYWPKDDELTISMLQRAEAAGYEAIVVTLDTWLLGWRPRDLQEAYLPFLRGDGVANYFSDPVFRSRLQKPPEDDPQMAILTFVSLFSDPSVTWERLALLRDNTSLPIVLKGINDPDDARRARDHGIDGVIVSNHGGRQVDGALAALDALPDVADAIGGDVDVLFDSGVRTGSDVVKALALGARAILYGRPWVFGLGLDGQAGVTHVLRNLLADLDLALALSGHADVATLTSDILRRDDRLPG